jgi:hypothetical protein
MITDILIWLLQSIVLFAIAVFVIAICDKIIYRLRGRRESRDIERTKRETWIRGAMR